MSECKLPLCRAIKELNIDVENNVQPDTTRYSETWRMYLMSGGSRTMLNDLPCNCQHKHFVRRVFECCKGVSD